MNQEGEAATGVPDAVLIEESVTGESRDGGVAVEFGFLNCSYLHPVEVKEGLEF